MTWTFTLNITVVSLKIQALSYNWFKALYKNVWNYKKGAHSKFKDTLFVPGLYRTVCMFCVTKVPMTPSVRPFRTQMFSCIFYYFSSS